MFQAQLPTKKAWVWVWVWVWVVSESVGNLEEAYVIWSISGYCTNWDKIVVLILQINTQLIFDKVINIKLNLFKIDKN